MEFASVLATGVSALDTSAAAALGIGLTGLGAALAQGRAVAPRSRVRLAIRVLYPAPEA